jgi:carbamoyl-phosphate synthase large subunit
MLFLVWKRAPIKTTLLRDLQDLCDVHYLEFEQASEVADGIGEFFQRLGTSTAPNGQTGG